MAALTNLTRSGQALGTGDASALFLKVFAGEVLTAFERTSVMMSRHMVRTIANGKSASFPVMGRALAQYLEAGSSLDDQRKAMHHNEKVITIDGLLTADAMIADIDDAMNHYDVRSEYSKQLGESLAVSADCAIINEIANLCKKDMTANIPTANGILGTGTGTELVVGENTGDAAYGTKVLNALIQARAEMTKNYVPASERVFVCSPDTYSALLMALMPSAANYQALFNPETGKLMPVAGFEIVEVPHFGQAAAGEKHPLDTSLATAELQGVVFHRSAAATVKLKDLAMERARRTEYQADQIVAKYAMGHGGLRPEAVCVLVKTAQA